MSFRWRSFSTASSVIHRCFGKGFRIRSCSWARRFPGVKKFQRQQPAAFNVAPQWHVADGWAGGGLYFRRIGDPEYFAPCRYGGCYCRSRNCCHSACAKSLADHVQAVAQALRDDGIEGGRKAVSMIVGRNPDRLDEGGVSRAAIESLAENASDGIVAPAFWFLVGGLPGLFAYKLINTADSMIGHLNDRYRDFGRFAAKLDDVANYIPARLTGLLAALATSLGHGREAGRQALSRSCAGMLGCIDRPMRAGRKRHLQGRWGWRLPVRANMAPRRLRADAQRHWKTRGRGEGYRCRAGAVLVHDEPDDRTGDSGEPCRPICRLG